MPFINATRQAGVALLTMLLVFAVVAAMAGELIYQQTMAIRKTSATMHTRQAREYALGGEALARQLLFRDWEEDRKNQQIADHTLESWASAFEPYEPDNGEIRLRIEDGESRFNLNNLLTDSGTVDQRQMAIFKRLLIALALDTRITEAVVDWMDGDQQPMGVNTEDQGYLGLEPAYRTADRPMAHISELRAVAGVTTEIYTKLAPYIAAIPGKTGINVNTAPVEILEAVMPGLNGSSVTALRNDADAAFYSTDSFLQHPITAGLPVPQVPLVVSSEYFRVTVDARFDDRRQALQSWVHRSPLDGRIRLIGRELISPMEIPADKERAAL